ncbi:MULTISPECIES: dipeptide epimerase [unclassified Modestobacter]|uniref:dipeptide epimerase n=1 Tax=unclassified Modestobacter TaxID=2643866 RepID=UPI0022AA8797|nr:MULTISPECIES: dipeptide epimerase [unclassified Modestobacter]MCZ2825661.1 dipeptide epimerase [Modestobacter sp. VKM Ac-2981]MCZ2853274.1 dipeptide epimerase [Modestobacter sp. VKM Ac-2982]
MVRDTVAVTCWPQELRLRDTFTIARSSTDTEEVLVVRVEAGGVTGHGEGAPVAYAGESVAGMATAVQDHGAELLGHDLRDLEGIARRLRAWDGPQGAKMALDGAAHDWAGRHAGLPVWRMLGLDGVQPPTSFTIGISTVEETVDRVRRAPGFEVYKVKVGGPDDLARLAAIREVSPARLRVDGNEGWTLDGVRELLPQLRQLGVEMIEQPFPRADLDAYARYRELPDRLPVFLDESCTDLGSVAPAAGLADGIVVKLAKCGGIREAHRMVHAAAALGLRVMLGCMIESQLGIAQAAQLGPLADLVDLDGHLLIADEPFTGLGFSAGRVVLPDAPGFGLTPAEAR